MKVIVEDASLVFERLSKDEFKVTIDRFPTDFPDKFLLRKGETLTINLPPGIIDMEIE